MRLWVRTLIRNSFFQVGAGIIVTMVLGGFLLQWFEPGEISKGDNPYWWAIVTMTTVGYGDFSPGTPAGRVFAVLIMFIGISLVSLLTASISSIFVAQKILFVILALTFYFAFGPEGILVGYGISLLLFSQIIYKSFKNTKVNFSIIRERINFLTHNYIAEISGTARNHIDKLIIAPLLGFSVLGNYFVGIQILELMLIIPGIVFKYTLPEDSTGRSTGKIKILTIVVSFFVMLLGIFVAPLVIPIVLPEYAATIDLIPILSLVVIPRTISTMIMSSFLGQENSKHVVIANIITFCVLVISIFPLSELFEVTGIAIAYVIGFSSSTVYLVAKYLQLRNKNN